jgi:hypothetical protein
MSVYANDDVMDAALNLVINNSSTFVICAGQPASYSDATTGNGNGGNALGESSTSSADFTLADGDTSGRKLTHSGKSGVSIDADGTADHVALIDDANSRLLLVTTLTSQGVTSGATADVDPFDEEIEDPS